MAAFCLVGCAASMTQEANQMSPTQLRQLSDDRICVLSRTYQSPLADPPTQNVLDEFKRRGVICGDKGLLYGAVGYTAERINADDDTTCRGYGLAFGTADYAKCRLTLQAQRGRMGQAQIAEDDAAQAARLQKFSKSMQDAATWMQGKNPNQPATNTNCMKTVSGFSCTSQ